METGVPPFLYTPSLVGKPAARPNTTGNKQRGTQLLCHCGRKRDALTHGAFEDGRGDLHLSIHLHVLLKIRVPLDVGTRGGRERNSILCLPRGSMIVCSRGSVIEFPHKKQWYYLHTWGGG